MIRPRIPDFPHRCSAAPRAARRFRSSLAVLALSTLLASPTAARADLALLGPPVALNTDLPCIASLPRVAALPRGEAVAAWRGSDPSSLFLRRVDADAAAADELRALAAGAPVEHLELAADAAGRLVLVWIEEGGTRLRAQRFGADGEPAGGEIDVAGGVEELVEPIGGVALAVRPEGDFVVVWSSPSLVRARRFDPDGTPRGEVVDVAYLIAPLCPGCFLEAAAPSVAMGPAGGFLVGFEIHSGLFPGESASSPVSRRFDVDGNPLGDTVLLAEGLGARGRDTAVGIDADGRGVVVWRAAAGGNQEMEGPFSLTARLLDAAGEPRGAPAELVSSPLPLDDPDLAVLPGGEFLVAWRQGDGFREQSRVLARSFNTVGEPSGAPVLIGGTEFGLQASPRLAVEILESGAAGPVTAVWESFPPFPPLLPPACPQPRTVFARHLGLGCVAGPDRLCLADGRFAVDVAWESPFHGTAGPGIAVPLTADTGAFWFFAPDNLELMVKVLDARGVNRHFWVFFGGLSNVAYTIRVTDTRSGTRRLYPNPAGRLASFADVGAFPEDPPAPGSPSAASAGDRPAVADAVDGPCTAAAESLCLQQERFEVGVLWRDPVGGATHSARPLPVTTDTGAFWFFDAENLELMVKVLDGRRINERFWVFYGSLTNVEFDLTVADRLTGAVRVYHNEAGRLASRADVAFPREPCACPPFIDPVCGTDGRTYSSPCDAERCAGVTVAHPGACDTSLHP